jgi:hypothetical protein
MRDLLLALAAFAVTATALTTGGGRQQAGTAAAQKDADRR